MQDKVSLSKNQVLKLDWVWDLEEGDGLTIVEGFSSSISPEELTNKLFPVLVN